jgi:diguanylate cyclase (GGDEF)-like protein
MQIFYKEAEYEAYRAYYQKQDRAQARKVIWVMMWALLPLAVFDLMLQPSDLNLALILLVRLLVAGYSWWTIKHFLRVVSPAVLDRNLTNWIVAVMLMQLLSNLLLPRDYFGQYSMDIWGCLMTFIVVPLPLAVLRNAVSSFVLASLCLLFYKHAPYHAYTLTVILMLPAAAITGYAVANYVHRYRRKLLGAEYELERQETTDVVTETTNWRSFVVLVEAELQRHVRSNQPMSLMVVDIVDFKKINEEYGPETGDVILAEVARRIKRVMRSYDSIGRYGSDEFCVLLPESNAEDAEKVASRTRMTVIALPVSAGGKEIKIQANIGVASLQPGDTMSALLQRAGNARGKPKMSAFKMG